MTTINNKRDLKFAYSMYRFLESELRRGVGFDNPDAVRGAIADEKRAIRAYYRRAEERRLANSDRRIVKDDGIDGCIVRIDMLEDFGSIDEARAWFEEYEYIHYRPSPYDCTGQCFTSWYDIFRHPDGHFIAYHRIACDC